ncbi:MAG: RNA-binding S4 domain-containing protein [Rhodospirillaceae bacterium]
MIDALRLDKWLWFARFCKSRALAQRMIDRGQVTLNGAAVEKTSTTVRPGDRLEIVLGPIKRRVRVRGLGERRGSAPEAQALYEETAPPERLHALEAALPLRTPLN